MFGREGRRPSNTNIRTMQLFHELKQKFPQIPDHVVTACIANHAHQFQRQSQNQDQQQQKQDQNQQQLNTDQQQSSANINKSGLNQNQLSLTQNQLDKKHQSVLNPHCLPEKQSDKKADQDSQNNKNRKHQLDHHHSNKKQGQQSKNHPQKFTIEEGAGGKAIEKKKFEVKSKEELMGLSPTESTEQIPSSPNTPSSEESTSREESQKKKHRRRGLNLPKLSKGLRVYHKWDSLKRRSKVEDHKEEAENLKGEIENPDKEYLVGESARESLKEERDKEDRLKEQRYREESCKERHSQEECSNEELVKVERSKEKRVKEKREGPERRRAERRREKVDRNSKWEDQQRDIKLTKEEKISKEKSEKEKRAEKESRPKRKSRSSEVTSRNSLDSKSSTIKSDNNQKRTYSAERKTYVPEPRGNSYRLTKSISPNREETIDNLRNEMNKSENGDINRNVIKPCVVYSKKSDSVCVNAGTSAQPESNIGNSSFYLRRPTHLDIKSDLNDNGVPIPKSERCRDVFKLLNSDNLSDRPPKSPSSGKRFTGRYSDVLAREDYLSRSLGASKYSPSRPERHPLASPEKRSISSSPTKELIADSPTKEVVSPLFPKEVAAQTSKVEDFPEVSTGIAKKTERSPSQTPKKELVTTPTQTTDTLIGGGVGGVNLSLNVNYSMDLVQSPTKPKCKTSLQITPQPHWCEDLLSQRSYTSVNLTLRPPSSEPQPPIDITSKNSSLTYSTSSFDRQNGLQSKLQITVGPNGGSVSSVRTRPRSSYIPEENNNLPIDVRIRAGSMPDLNNVCKYLFSFCFSFIFSCVKNVFMVKIHL